MKTHAPAPAEESLIGQVVEQFTDELNGGQQPQIDNYTKRYPHIADELRQVLPAVEMMCHVGADSASLSEEAADAADAASHASGCLGNFRILREVGRGGMGVVYEAEQLSLKRRVALKVLPFAAVLDPRHLQRFKNEALAAAQLEDPHIVPVYGVGCERGVHHYAMRFIEGLTLAEAIDELRLQRTPSERLPAGRTPPDPDARTVLAAGEASTSSPVRMLPRDTSPLAALSTVSDNSRREFDRSAARLARDVAGALDYAHENGVVHRDIKPGNIMLDGRGKAWVTDFGLARIESDHSLTMSGDLLGTLRYMSPEQALSKRVVVDHRTDIYSLGVTLYELLTLEPAFPETDRQALLQRIAFEDPTPVRQLDPQIPADLETIVLKATAKNPDERYDTAGDLADDLQRFLDHQPIKARRPTLRQRLAKWTLRHTALVWSASAILLTSTLALAVSTLLISRARTQSVKTAIVLQQALAEKNVALGEKDLALQRERATNQRVYPTNIANAWDHAQHSFDHAYSLLSPYLPHQGTVDLRGFEWHYLWGLIHDPGQTIAGHRANVYSVDFSPDGELFVTGSGDHTARLYRTKTGELLHVLTGHTSDVNRAFFSPSGSLIATASDDHTIGLWDPASGEQVTTLHGHDDMVSCVRFSSDERLLFSTGVDGSLKVWDLASQSVLASTQAHDEPIQSLAVSPDGMYLATCCRLGARVWRSPTLALVQTIDSADDQSLQSVTFRPDIGALVAAWRSGWLRTLDIDSGAVLDERFLNTYLLSLACAPDGGQLATAGTKDGHPVLTLCATSLKAKSTYRFHSRQNGSWCTTYSRGGRFLGAGNERLASVIPRDLPPDHLQIIDIPDGADAVLVSPDSRRILVGGRDGLCREFERISGVQVQTWQAHEAGLTSFCSSPAGDWLATGGGDAVVHIWNLSTGTRVHSLMGFTHGIRDIHVSQDGALLAACDGTRLRVWETRKWRPLGSIPSAGTNVAFAFDNGLLMCGVMLGFRQNPHDLWSGGVPRPPESPVQAMDVTPSGQLVALGCKNAHVMFWSEFHGRPMPIGRHGNQVWSVAFSPDGRTLATVDSDGTVLLWNVATGTTMMTFGLRECVRDEGESFHAFETLNLQFAPDNSALVAAGTYKRSPEDAEPRGLVSVWRGDVEGPTVIDKTP